MPMRFPTDRDEEEKWLAETAPLSPDEKSILLVKSAKEGDTWRIERLLEMGADAAWHGHRPLMEAAAEGHLAPVSVLLRHADDDEIRNDALVEAVAASRAAVVKLLLKSGVNPAYGDSIVMFFAVQKNSPEIADMLLKAGADVSAHKGALMCIALSHGHDKVAEVLLKNGGDPNTYYRDKNAFDWAAELGHVEFSRALRDWAADDMKAEPSFFEGQSVEKLRAPLEGHQGRTGFHVAAASGCFSIIRDKILQTPGEQLTAKDLTMEATHIGPSVLLLLGQAKELNAAFDARLWAGRKNEMLQAYDEVPSAYRAQIDLPAISSAIDRLALKQRGISFAPKQRQRFSLKP